MPQVAHYDESLVTPAANTALDPAGESEISSYLIIHRKILMIHRKITNCLIPALFLSTIGFLRADVKLPAIFGDHMVLQQDATLPIWD